MKLYKILGISLISLILGIIILGAVSYVLKAQAAKQEEERRQELYTKILEPVSTGPANLTVRFDKQVGTSSPLLFGGAHTPLLNHQDAWDKIAEAGVTNIRRDFFIEQILPNNITLEDYKNNKNNIQDPAKWNQNLIKAAGERFKEAKKRGMKTIGIVDYAPPWLTHSGTPYGLPRDWDVYEDIVKRTYALYRDDLDYLEIWNEPTYSRFNDVRNSGKSMEDIYVEIAKHTIKAIREVDKEKNDGRLMPLGGLVADNPKYGGGMLDRILKEPEIKNELAFISYHTYGHEEPSSMLYREIMEKNGAGDMPMFLTEWNSSPDERKNEPIKIGDEAILYTAKQFMTFMKQGLVGTNYYMLEPVDFNIPGIGVKSMGFYRVNNGKAELLPQARTWRLMSKKMGLGNGDGKLYSITQNTSDLETIAFINSIGERGLLAINDTEEGKGVNLTFTSTGIGEYANVEIYYASPANDATSPVYDGLVKTNNGDTRLTFYVPKQTIMGVKFSEDKDWYDIFQGSLDKIIQ